MAKDILFDPELRDQLREGSQAVRKLVEANYGPEGKTTIREQIYDLPLIANTGRRVLQEVSVKASGVNIAAVLVREAALKVAAECGDGSIATTILADSIIARGQKLIASGYDPMAMRRGAHKAVNVVKERIGELTIPFEEVGVERFAAATAKNDEVASNVAKAFEKVGVDGVITVQDTQGRETILNIWDGARYDYGVYSQSFILDQVRKKSVLMEPYVLLSNVKINSLQDIRKVLEDVIRTGSSLLIITNDMAEEVQQILAVNVVKGLKVVVAKAPGYGNTRRRNMFSLAAKIGSLVFEENTGLEMRDCGLEICAQIGRAEVDKDFTVLQGFRDSSPEMVEILQKNTQGELEKTSDPDEREKLQTTLSILNGKNAEILVGAVVEYEMFEKKYLYENTVRSVQNAARSGLVPGAGSEYVALARKIDNAAADYPETEKQGALCVSQALRGLVECLAENAGDDGAVVLNTLMEQTDSFRGYDVQRHEMVDLKAAGILSARSTVETVIAVATETAASLWTTGVAVIEK